MFEKYGPEQKTGINKMFFIIHFTKVSEKMVQIGLLVTEIQNVGENICSTFYNVKLIEKYEQYKKVHEQNNFIFPFYVRIPNFV